MKIRNLIEALQDFEMSNSTDGETEVFFDFEREGSIRTPGTVLIIFPIEELYINKSSNRLILTSRDKIDE